jgi:glycosyltransferase involved in cell wall biosynthesis
MMASLAMRPRRVLFVFAWLVVGGEETEVRLLARHLNPARYRVEVVACFRKPNMPEQTHVQLAQLGVPVDRTPYGLSPEETVEYLARKMAEYDLVVACQAVREVYPALERVPPQRRPPLIEHGGLVSEALAGPKHLTARYVGVCASIRDAAASLMPERPDDAIEIPSMVDLSEFDGTQRACVRAEWQVAEDTIVIGWVGRLDRKKRVEDFIRAAALVRREMSRTRFVVIGGPDAFMPEYADELRTLMRDLGLDGALDFLGDLPDVPRLLSGFDVFVWLSQGEGMPHVISEAGAAGLPVIATRDNGTEEQIADGETGLFVPHRSPGTVATAIQSLIADPPLRRRLGGNLHRKVAREYSAAALIPQWEMLFDEVCTAHDAQQLGADMPPPQ